MARRPSMSDAGVTRPSQAVQPPVAAPAEPASTASRRPLARQGKKAVSFWVDPAASDQLRIAAVTHRRSVQRIMEEALDGWFAQHSLPRLCSSPATNGKVA